MNGKDGKDGINGKDGMNGIDGKDGVNGTNSDFDPYFLSTLFNDTT